MMKKSLLALALFSIVGMCLAKSLESQNRPFVKSEAGKILVFKLNLNLFCLIS